MWFKCKEKDCNYVSVKTKKDKIKRFWRHGQSLEQSYRQRTFMRYVEGYYRRLNNGDTLVFDCKYGTILMYDADENACNSYIYPIEDKESCRICIERIKNEGALFQ